jgi:hypothetical protein
LAEHPGVEEKLLGMFTERRTLARMIRLSPGASFRVAGRSIYFAYSGTGRVEREPLRTFTAAFLDHGEDATFAADKPKSSPNAIRLRRKRKPSLARSLV